MQDEPILLAEIPVLTQGALIKTENHFPTPASIPDDRERINATDRVILIVEDDTNFAQALMDFSRKNGFKCLSAVSGDDGILMAIKYKPLAILLDINSIRQRGTFQSTSCHRWRQKKKA
jgi:PleD family two-component response regulator